MKEEIKIDIKTEHIQALLEGKRMVYQIQGLPTIILYPERYGVFMTHEKFMELKRKIGWKALTDTDGFFKELLGVEMFEKVFNNSKPHGKI